MARRTSIGATSGADGAPSGTRVATKPRSRLHAQTRARARAAGQAEPGAPLSAESLAQRKPAVRMADVPPEVRQALNAGIIESTTLAECLSVDHRVLAMHVLPELGEVAAERLDPALGITRRMQIMGQLIAARFGLDCFDTLARHPSDTVRGWAAYALGAAPDLTIAERLDRVRPLADDHNPGMREWAWIALRPRVAEDLPGTLAALQPWVTDEATNIRRYAVEITRPRGVWCAHLPALKFDPSPGSCLLEPVKADPQRYVQNAVANWLNDASKSHGDWVRAVCDRWLHANAGCKATTYITRRALRTVNTAPRN